MARPRCFVDYDKIILRSPGPPSLEYGKLVLVNYAASFRGAFSNGFYIRGIIIFVVLPNSMPSKLNAPLKNQQVIKNQQALIFHRRPAFREVQTSADVCHSFLKVLLRYAKA
jgi:hypothetical protein